ncbi:MAG: hypothetical protein FWD56_05795 [Bacteroidales bacterium]|nr:hypothetical protein [Bacteroidales bacterium]
MGRVAFLCFVFWLFPSPQALATDPTSCPTHTILITNDTLTIAFHLAATYYPDLCSTKIHLKYGKIKTSMAALPRFGSIFKKPHKRTYKIIVNANPNKPQARLIYDAPFDAIVGVMGHELAHVSDYNTKSSWQIARTGIRYMSKNQRKTIEHQTDSITIARGLGMQLYQFAYYVAYEADLDEAYRQYKLDIYMSPEDIYNAVTTVGANGIRPIQPKP